MLKSDEHTSPSSLVLKLESWKVFRSLKYTLIQLHSVSGILGYKINFDTNGDAEFNLTLLDMQLTGKRMLILVFSGATGRVFPGSGISPKNSAGFGKR